MPTIKIYTFADKRPEFISYQYACFKKHLLDSFEFIVFNNASSEELRIEIEASCNNIGLQCIPCGQMDHSGPTVACSIPLQWAFHNVIRTKGDEIACVIDSDMFLLNPFSIVTYLEFFDLSGRKDKRGHVNYLWNGLMFFRLKSLPKIETMNFREGTIERFCTDVGGYLYNYFKSNDIKLKGLHHVGYIHSRNENLCCLPEKYRDTYKDEFLFEIFESAFLHYRAGSNWNRLSKTYHDSKWEYTKAMIEESIRGELVLPDSSSFVFHHKDVWSVHYPQRVDEFTRILQDGRITS